MGRLLRLRRQPTWSDQASGLVAAGSTIVTTGELDQQFAPLSSRATRRASAPRAASLRRAVERRKPLHAIPVDVVDALDVANRVPCSGRRDLDGVAGSSSTLLHDAEVGARPPGRGETPPRNPGSPIRAPELPARDPRLAGLQQHGADPPALADQRARHVDAAEPLVF